MSLLSKIITNVENWLSGAKSEAEKVLTIANQFGNEILAFAATPTGKTIEGIIETIIPADLVNAAKLWLPKLFVDLNWATAEAGKSDEQITADGINYLASTTGDVKASQINSLVALTGKFISDNNEAGLTIQQALTVAQPVHAPLTI